MLVPIPTRISIILYNETVNGTLKPLIKHVIQLQQQVVRHCKLICSIIVNEYNYTNKYIVGILLFFIF